MATQEKQRTPTGERPVRKTPDVVYTQPKPFRRNRFLLHMATAVAVVLALILGMAIFFKVKEVHVSGSDKYSPWDIKVASGIQDGDHLLTLSKAEVAGKIIQELPYIKSVRVGIKLPDQVNIEVEMLSVFYAIEDDAGQWWKIAADGKIVDKIAVPEKAGLTKIQGVQITGAQPGMKAVAAEPVPEETMADGETVPVTVYGSERLSAAISVLQHLEKRAILGEMTSVDVSDINAIAMYRGDYFRVSLGDTSRMDEKILSLRVYMNENGSSNAGELDVSFTIWTTATFTPKTD